jgi:transcriptional regulator with PAS, ATPase and Fis domain
VSVRKSPQVLKLEAEHGRPAAEVIADAITEHGSIYAAARALGVSHNTLFSWCFRLGVKVTTTTKATAVVL